MHILETQLHMAHHVFGFIPVQFLRITAGLDCLHDGQTFPVT
jgi:hypothetical protein